MDSYGIQYLLSYEYGECMCFKTALLLLQSRKIRKIILFFILVFATLHCKGILFFPLEGLFWEILQLKMSQTLSIFASPITLSPEIILCFLSKLFFALPDFDKSLKEMIFLIVLHLE